MIILAVIGVLAIIVGILYVSGAANSIHFMVSVRHGHHQVRAIVAFVIGIACLVGAYIAWTRPAGRTASASASPGGSADPGASASASGSADPSASPSGSADPSASPSGSADPSASPGGSAGPSASASASGSTGPGESGSASPSGS